jgi:hypothetical protein
MLKLKAAFTIAVRFLFCFFCQSGFAQTHTPITATINSNCKGYWEYLPVNYANTNTKYPLIVYIHGAGSYGAGTTSSLQSLLTNEGITYYINQNLFPATFTVNGITTSFIVISPQFVQKASPANVKQVIDYMVQHYRVDEARIYLTGYSVGGDVAWKAPFSLAAATRLAGLVPVAGYNRDPYVDTTAKYIAAGNLPVWAIHSNGDGAVPVQASIDMVNKINSFNPATPAIITRLSGISHENTVRAAYDPSFRPNGKNIYEWFLSYNRSYPPVANAGPDQTITLPVNSASFNGSNSSDPESGPLTYSWTKVSGPSRYTLTNADQARPTASNLVAGVYKFRLEVTDISLLTTADTVALTVINPNPNQLPFVVAGNDQSIFLPQTSVSLSGNGSSDPDGSIESYAWTRVSGPASYNFSNPSSIATTVTGLKTGTYVFRLTATDNEGGSNSATVTVNVINPFPNVLPVANAGADQTIELPLNSVALNGASSSDADGSIVGYQWKQVSGPSTSVISTPNSMTTTAGNLVLGTYQFQLLVTDDSSGIAKDTVRIIVNPIPPTITQKLIKVNVYGGTTPAGAGWNNWNTQSTLSSGGLLYSDGTASGVSAVLSAHTNTGDNGSGYPTTMCPPEVGRTASYSTVSRTLTISGLDNNKRYDLETYASRIGGNATRFSIGTTSITIQTDRNYSNKAVFNNITPSAGKIVLNIGVITTFGYINGFTLTENTTNPVNASPVCMPGANQTINLPASQVSLDGSGSYDPDGSIVTYIWQQLSGPTATITNSASAATTVTGLTAAGSYVFQLTVIDNKGYTSSSQVTITQNPPLNALPLANAGTNQVITLPSSQVSLDASGSSDPDGTIVSYSWTTQSGPAVYNFSDVTVANPTVNNLVAGTYVFRVSVTDNSGGVATADVSVVVQPDPSNLLPVVNAGTDQTITLPVNTVTLTGSASDPEGLLISHTWTQTGGPTITIGSPNNLSLAVNFASAGTYVFRLTGVDNSGGTSTDDVVILVNPPLVPNQLPAANAGTAQTITLPVSSVRLDASASADPDGNIVSYSWAQQSGPSTFSFDNASLVKPTVSNLVAGQYVFRVTVTDNDNASSFADVTVTVNPAANQPPVANAGTGQSITLPVSQVNLNASLSSDPDGNIVSYAWTRQSGPSSYSFSNAAISNPVVSGLVQGTYVFRVTVKDNDNATSFADVSIIVNAAELPPGTNRYVRVNIYGGSNAYNNAAWNDWNVGGNTNPLASGLFKYDDGTTSGISAVLSNQSLVSDNGSGYGTTMCPSAVGRTASYYTATRTLTISGLDNSKQYSLELYASRNSTASGVSRFTVGSNSVDIATDNNFSNKASFVSLTPSGGKIVVSIAKLNNFNYVNGFVLTETGAGGNQAPVTNAGPDQTISLPLSQVQLKGDLSADPDGTIDSYSWSRQSGPAQFSFDNSATANPVVSNLVAGTYVFRLTTIDNGGGSSFDDVTIKVNAANLLPLANAGQNQSITLPVSQVNLNASASVDPDGSIQSYSWTKQLGPSSFTFSNTTLVNPTVTNLVAGEYVFRVTVTDNNNATAFADVTVTVNPEANQLPIANAGTDQTISLPTSQVQLSAINSSDPDGTIGAYAWTKQSGPSSFAFNNATIVNPVVSNLVAGSYVFKVTVTDNKGATASATVTIVVNPADNRLPVANAGPDQTITAPASTANLNGSGTDMMALLRVTCGR